ncbi:hypothetical protein LCGC14_0829780 [marine sediment metagenome]|uniref:Uncharacterized protein n=1 Tax=marine sediment metagenome TaxID=412755 RepID=A0A0F9SNM0_9ZZZZ
MERLLYRQGNYGSICFPYKESCEFATKKCIKECTEQHNNMSWFKEIFEDFKKKSSISLYAQIKQEMQENNFTMLSWFDCGDCPIRLTIKVVQIMEQLREDGFWQIGFTRNKKLWKQVKDLCNVRFMLTVERGTKLELEGYYSIPDYSNQRTAIVHYHTYDKPIDESIDQIISEGYANIRYCGGGGSYIETKKVTEPKLVDQCFAFNSNTGTCNSSGDPVNVVHEANCQYCYEDNEGCFSG